MCAVAGFQRVLAVLLTLVVTGGVIATPQAGAQKAARAWDGFDQLLTLAESAGVDLVQVNKLSLAEVSARDALLIVGPHKQLPVTALSAFLREGGRIALLDDFGSGGRFLSAYQVERGEAPQGGPALRSDPRLLLAYPRSEHPLAEGVPVLLTNEASTLRHPDLKPVFVFGHSERALALAGAVGAGRLVAIGDASLLINQLMMLPAHQRFARNLLEYLSRASGRVWFLGPDAELVGSFGDPERQGSAFLDAWLKRVAHPDLPPSVLLLIAFSLAAIGAVIALTTLPRKSPYLRAALFPDDSVYAGFAGHVALSRQTGSNLMWPLLDLRQELITELTTQLALGSPFDNEAAMKAAAELGLDKNECRRLGALLSRLSELAAAQDEERKKGRPSPSELTELVREAGVMTALIEEKLVRGSDKT
jgi:hypothetical protein